MKSFAEIDLVAFHLHLLSPEQEFAVRTAISLDPRLAAQSNAIAATLQQFDRQEYPTMIGTAILDDHWQRLRPSLAPHRVRSPFAAWLLPISLAVAVAALLVITFWFASWSTSSSSAPQQAVAPQTSSPAPGSPSPSPLHATVSTQPSHRRDSEPTPQTFSHFTLPIVDYALVPPPETAVLSMPHVSNQEFLQLPLTTANVFPPSSSSASPIPTPSATPPPAKRHHTETDISIGVFGNFTATRNHNITTGPTLTFQTQSATPTAGVVGAFHQQFRPWLGYRIATSYAHSTLTYSGGQTGPSGTYYGATTIPAGIHELTAAYTAQGPRNKRVTTDTELGGGVLVFVPSPGYTTNSALFPSGPVYVDYNYRRTAVGGVGVNFHVSRRLDLRTEYRALVYENPSFRALSNTHYTVTSEPAVSITYRFGKNSDK